MDIEGPATEDTSPDESRSGADIAEAIEVAERGSSVQEVHDRPGETRSGEAPVERSAGDPEMTEGQVVLGDGAAGGSTGAGPAAPEGVSGGAQSQQGARASDRAAAQPSDG
ncbi:MULTISPECIES: hypothetical protein [unclassified Geodermatophilus]|uniref:hypothetical protein n=1 Tax=unclassified Geodermatophilus TaxID=2637632 RepID=UPI003EE9520C